MIVKDVRRGHEQVAQANHSKIQAETFRKQIVIFFFFIYIYFVMWFSNEKMMSSLKRTFWLIGPDGAAEDSTTGAAATGRGCCTRGRPALQVRIIICCFLTTPILTSFEKKIGRWESRYQKKRWKCSTHKQIAIQIVVFVKSTGERRRWS